MLDLSASQRLCLVLERRQEDVYEPEFAAEAPLVRFAAYADHARVFGFVRLRADRLTDLLNASHELRLVHVEIESLVDGATRTADEVNVPRAELVAVHASGPRGSEASRRRTRIHPIALQSGNYLVGGYLHAEPGIEPLASLHQRPPMVPLTDAWLEYWSGGQRKRQWVGTIVVNRDRAEWVHVVSEDDLTEGRLRPLVTAS